MRWRMRQAADGQGIYQQLARFGREQQPLIRQVLQAVREQGALGAGSLSTRQERAGPWWDWSAEKHALEWLFAAGELTVAGRRGFERLYDLPEQVFPAELLARPSFRRHRPSASCCGWRRAPWAWPPKGPARLLSAEPGAEPSRASPNWWRLASCCRSGRGLEPAGLLPRRTAGAAAARRQCLALALRLVGLGAGAGRAPVRFPLSPGDLHAEGKTRVRLLRAAIPVQRPSGRPRRPPRRAGARAPGGACVACRGERHGRCRPARGWPSSCAAWPPGWAWRRWRSRGAGSWRYACAGCCSGERSRRAAERPRRAQRRTCFRVSAIRKASSSDWSAFSRGSQWVW